jgi:hypothetical protein
LELVKGIGKHLVNQGQVSETVSSPRPFLAYIPPP